MTRIPHIVFGLLIGLTLGAVFYFFFYIDGPMDQRLLRVGLITLVATAVAWFMAARVRDKNQKEQLKQRLYAILMLVLAVGAMSFADYKAQQGKFIDNCTEKGGNLYVCRCIEKQTGPKIWLEQMQQRPQVALGSLTRERAWASVSRSYGTNLAAAARSCAGSAR